MLLLWIYLAGVLATFPVLALAVQAMLRGREKGDRHAVEAAGRGAAELEIKYPVAVPALRALIWPISIPMTIGMSAHAVFMMLREGMNKSEHVKDSVARHGIYAETDDATQFVAVEWFMKHPCPTRQKWLDDRFSKMSIFNPEAERGALPMHMYAVLDFGHPGDQPTVDASCDLCGAILEKANLAAERKKNTPPPKGAILPSGGFAPKGMFVAVDATLDSISIHEAASHEDVVIVEAKAPDGMTLVATTDRKRLSTFHEILTRFLEPIGDPTQDVQRFRWNIKSNGTGVEQVNDPALGAPRN